MRGGRGRRGGGVRRAALIRFVGRAGREAIYARLPDMRKALGADLVVVNGENAAKGFGITADICEKLYSAGTDVIVTGNHVWGQFLKDYKPTDW